VKPPWTDVTLVLAITGAENFAPHACASPTVTIDESKLRDVMILSTLKIATNPYRAPRSGDCLRQVGTLGT
jgi:hypothetical protein